MKIGPVPAILNSSRAHEEEKSESWSAPAECQRRLRWPWAAMDCGYFGQQNLMHVCVSVWKNNFWWRGGNSARRMSRSNPDIMSHLLWRRQQIKPLLSPAPLSALLIVSPHIGCELNSFYGGSGSTGLIELVKAKILLEHNHLNTLFFL